MLSFTAKVREVVKKIPKGEVMTYKQVATLAGNPAASRAVANTMAANYDIDIPCHRVIRTDGTMGGYNRGGVKKKREILLAEGAKI